MNAIESSGGVLNWEDMMYVDYIKRFMEEHKGWRVEGLRSLEGGVEITASDTEGRQVLVRLIGSKVPLSEVNAEVVHGAHEGEASGANYVYVAVPSRKLIYLSRRTRQILSEKSVGILEVRADGGVVEVLAPRRRETRVAAPPPQPTVKVERPTASPVVLRPEPAMPAVPTTEVEAGGEGLPDFVKNNPWLSVLSRRRAGGE